MVRAGRLSLRAGLGVEGDVNAAAGSPRHVLIVSAADLERYALEPGDLRENIAVDDGIDRLESGSLVQVGSSSIVRVTFPCEPCHKLNSVRRGLAYELQGNARGMLGRVVRSGTIRSGDSVRVAPGACRPLSDVPRERLWDAVERIPWGQVATYAALVLGIGVPRTFTRALPRLLKKGPSGLPLHRVLDSQARLIEQHVPDQRERLLREGASIGQGGRVDHPVFWDPTSLYAECEHAACR